MAGRTAPRRERLLIGGAGVPSGDGQAFQTSDPATGEAVAEAALAGVEDVHRAVAVARAAFDDGPWPRWTASARGRALLEVARLLRDRLETLAELETRDSGKALADARDEVAAAANTFEYYAGAANKLFGETIPLAQTGLDFTLREPVGVAALIIPWNFPIVIAPWKLAPALAVGCTVLLKPASNTPLTALALGDIRHEAGIPPGVVNGLPGAGDVAGMALARHPRVGRAAVTGATEGGPRLMGAAPAN